MVIRAIRMIKAVICGTPLAGEFKGSNEIWLFPCWLVNPKMYDNNYLCLLPENIKFLRFYLSFIGTLLGSSSGVQFNILQR